MAQHGSLQIPNVIGPDFRDELNEIFYALATNNSGSTEPPTPFPYMLWPDETTGLLKQRSADNMSWITIGTLGSANLGLATLGANTFTGAQDFDGQTLTRATLRDYGEKVNALGSISGTVAISSAEGNVATATVAGDVEFSFATTWPAGFASTLTLRLTNGGAHNVTWPAGAKWPLAVRLAGGGAPVLATEGDDWLTFMTLDGGATWYGAVTVLRERPKVIDFPAVASVTESTFTTLTDSHLVAMPAAVAAGDLLLAIVTSYAPSIVKPDDWAQKLQGTFSGAALGVFAKIATGSEAGGTVDFATTQDSRSVAAQVIRVTGWHGSLDGVVVSDGVAGMSRFPNPDSLTAPWGSGKTLWLAAAGAVDDAEAFTAAPAGYSGLTSTVANAGADSSASTGSAWRQVEAASENAASFTLGESFFDGEAWGAAMIGVRSQ